MTVTVVFLTFSLHCDIQRTSHDVIHMCVMMCIVRHVIDKIGIFFRTHEYNCVRSEMVNLKFN